MTCATVTSSLSAYLDDALKVAEMRQVSAHLEECLACRQEFAQLRSVQAMVTSLGRHPAPRDLALRIRVAAMQRQNAALRHRMQAWSVRLENTINSFMLPATAGLVSAMIVFGLFVGFFVAPPPVPASMDVPTVLYMPARLTSSLPAAPVFTNGPVVVVIHVDANGRLEDYHIVEGEDSPRIRKELDRSLLFTQFQPAVSFGQPAPGSVVISFDNVNVTG